MRYSAGFMLGSDCVSLFGWNHSPAFEHVELSNRFTWADPDRDLAVALLTTGLVGPHLTSFFESPGRHDMARRRSSSTTAGNRTLFSLWMCRCVSASSSARPA
jgi:CubicO group peptidase (beta-lactamase class C family)